MVGVTAETALAVGVLALQGDVREHVQALTAAGATAVSVRRPSDLDRVSGLVIPGGESSVIDKLARNFGMREPIQEAIARQMPMFGTCAGLILLSDRVVDGIVGQQTFGGIDVTVRRNAFGSQVDSFETPLEVPVIAGPPVHAVFIRAPLVEEVGPAAEVIATLPDGRVVGVRQGNLMGTSFHPEMTHERRFHELFLESVRAYAAS